MPDSAPNAGPLGWLRGRTLPEASTLQPAEGSQCPPGKPDPDLDATLLAILEQPHAHNDTLQVAYQRKELAVRDLFARLDVKISRAMHARLSAPQPGDEVAERFGRLIAERRGRLLAFLADVRRRQALAGRGRR